MEKFVLNENSSFKENRKKYGFFSFLFSQNFFMILLLILQMYLIFKYSHLILTKHLYSILLLINFIAYLYILNTRKIKVSYKISWVIFIEFVPLFGLLFFIIVRLVSYFDKDKKKLQDNVFNSYQYFDDESKNQEVIDNTFKKISELYGVPENLIANEKGIHNYFKNFAKTPIYVNTKIKYFSDGKIAFEDILEKLASAKKFIFIEMFIVKDGIIWQEILKILKEKVKEGVEIKLFFDGLNAVNSFGKSYCEELSKYGIEAKLYKPLLPFISNSQNNRDHRKFIIIDNEIAYTGGINIADEYANLYERFGHWKDDAVRVEGKIARSFTIMFLQLWNVYDKTKLLKFDNYLIDKDFITNETGNIVIPYSDYPSSNENIAEQNIKYLLSTAKKYIYIMTPYLVIDDALEELLEETAKRGVDIKIIVPHIQDKKYVHFVNRSYYRTLTMSGVKVYEYMPGFIHSKLYLQDDIRAIVGTTNLDFRSLYLHTENDIYLYGDKAIINDIYRDFDEILKISKHMTINEIGKIPVIQKVLGAILKMFAPLL